MCHRSHANIPPPPFLPLPYWQVNNDTQWEIKPTSQTLKGGSLTYIFSTEEDPALFYAVTLAADTTPEAVGVLEAVLEAASLYK
jgi:hypothetical protein